nr:hypothetical protein Iba_chr06bCG11530 [Ipomoea batatas]
MRTDRYIRHVGKDWLGEECPLTQMTSIALSAEEKRRELRSDQRVATAPQDQFSFGITRETQGCGTPHLAKMTFLSLLTYPSLDIFTLQISNSNNRGLLEHYVADPGGLLVILGANHYEENHMFVLFSTKFA